MKTDCNSSCAVGCCMQEAQYYYNYDHVHMSHYSEVLYCIYTFSVDFRRQLVTKSVKCFEYLLGKVGVQSPNGCERSVEDVSP